MGIGALFYLIISTVQATLSAVDLFFGIHATLLFTFVSIEQYSGAESAKKEGIEREK